MRMILYTLIFLTSLVVNVNAQERYHHIMLSPLCITEVGVGISACYQLKMDNQMAIELPATLNWNLPSMLYGSAITDVYKSRILRFMPNFKYYVLDKERVKYAIGIGASIGLGWDQQLSENYSGTFHQLGTFIDNAILVFSSSGVFGIGGNLGFGYHFKNNIHQQYQNEYDLLLLRLGFNFVLRF